MTAHRHSEHSRLAWLRWPLRPSRTPLPRCPSRSAADRFGDSSRFFPATLEVGRFPGTQDCMGTLVPGTGAPVAPIGRRRARRVGEPGVVVSVAMLGAGRTRPATTWPGRPTAPPTTTSAPSRSGRWAGSGAEAAGLTGHLDAAGATTLRALLEGTTPDGRQLVAPVLRADPRGRLPAGPLVDAVQARADHTGVPVEKLFADPTDRARYAALAARVARPGKRGRAAPWTRPGPASSRPPPVSTSPRSTARTPSPRQ